MTNEKCEYGNLDLPCSYCRLHGFQCTDKTLGPKKEAQNPSRIHSLRQSLLSIFRIRTADEDHLPPNHRMNIEHFYSFWPDSRSTPRLFRSRLGSRVAIELYNTGLPNSVLVYRFAIFVLMSFLKNDPADETHRYLALYYQEAQKCINASSITEVVFASYLVAVYSLIGAATLQMAFDNCRRFCHAVAYLKLMSTAKGDEFIWIETLWQDLLSSLYHLHRAVVLLKLPEDPHHLTRSFQHLQGLLNDCSCLLVSEEDISRLPLSMTTEVICHKARALSVIMQFYLHHFLFQVTHTPNGVEDTKTLRSELCSILDRIIRLISHLSNIADYIHHAYSSTSESDSQISGMTCAFLNFPDVKPRGLKSIAEAKVRDTALAILYTFARLVKSMLELPVGVDEALSTDIEQSAIALCRLCATIPVPSSTTMYTFLVKRTLFWAGLILTQSKFPLGILCS